MAKYRKKPVIVEAFQWLGFGKGPQDPDIQSHRIPMPGPANLIPQVKQWGQGWIETLEGGHVVTPGDWIITGVKGERYPCKPDIFEQTYEPAD